MGALFATRASQRAEAPVNRLGAHVIIHYPRERFEDRLADYDCAFALIGGDAQQRLWPVPRPGG